MKKKTKLIGALALALVLGVAMITGCSAGGQTKSGTIKIATCLLYTSWTLNRKKKRLRRWSLHSAVRSQSGRR